MFRHVFHYDDATFAGRSTSVRRNGNSSGEHSSLSGPSFGLWAKCCLSAVLHWF